MPLIGAQPAQHYYDPRFSSPEVVEARKRDNANLGFTAGLGPFLKFVATAGAYGATLDGGSGGVQGTPGWNPNASTPGGGSMAGDTDWAKLISTYGPAALSVAGSVASNSKGARTSTSMPTVAPEYKGLADLLRQRAMERLTTIQDMSGYAANGITGINDAYAGAQQHSDSNLTARGLASSPVAGAVGSNFDTSRAGSIAEFLNTLPLLQRQFQNEDFTNANALVGRNTGVTSVGAGSAAGAGLDDLSAWLGYLNRQRQLDAQKDVVFT